MYNSKIDFIFAVSIYDKKTMKIKIELMEHILSDRKQWSLGLLDQFISGKGNVQMFIGAVYSEVTPMITMKKEVMCMQ